MILHSIFIDQHDCFFQGYSEFPVTHNKIICACFIKEMPSYYFKEETKKCLGITYK